MYQVYDSPTSRRFCRKDTILEGVSRAGKFRAGEHCPSHLPQLISSFLVLAWEKRSFAAALGGTACLGAGPSTVALNNSSLLLAKQNLL
jgi:hypothetical protein